MPLSGTFDQVFTFESKANDGSLGDLVITAQSHPFIRAATENGNQVRISVDGAEALAFTQAKSDSVESLKIKLNGDQSFTFKIKLILPEQTAQPETTEEKEESQANNTDVSRWEIAQE